jgi:hypothetical protein
MRPPFVLPRVSQILFEVAVVICISAVVGSQDVAGSRDSRASAAGLPVAVAHNNVPKHDFPVVAPAR